MRGGAGGSFLRIEAEGDGGSGILPADSLSNMDSRSDSWEVRFGARGRGLLRSVLDRFGGLELKIFWDVMEIGVGGWGDASAKDEDEVEGSSRNSTLISFPCRELGGGGFFRADVAEGNSADIP